MEPGYGPPSLARQTRGNVGWFPVEMAPRQTGKVDLATGLASAFAWHTLQRGKACEAGAALQANDGYRDHAIAAPRPISTRPASWAVRVAAAVASKYMQEPLRGGCGHASPARAFVRWPLTTTRPIPAVYAVQTLAQPALTGMHPWSGEADPAVAEMTTVRAPAPRGDRPTG